MSALPFKAWILWEKLLGWLGRVRGGVRGNRPAALKTRRPEDGPKTKRVFFDLP